MQNMDIILIIHLNCDLNKSVLGNALYKIFDYGLSGKKITQETMCFPRVAAFAYGRSVGCKYVMAQKSRLPVKVSGRFFHSGHVYPSIFPGLVFIA